MRRVRSWRGKRHNEGISDEPCVDRAGVSYVLLETPALLMYDLRRITLLRGWVNKLLRYCRAGYRGCIFGLDSELIHRESEAGLP
jgi:hypothetical protein